METRIKENIVSAVLSALFIAIISLISGTVQGQTVNNDAPANEAPADPRMKDENITHANNVHLTAKAVPLMSSINGPYSELKPALAPDGKRLYFSRFLHPENTHDEDYEDIWYTDFDDESGSWSDPVRLHGVLNNHGPNYINNVSVTGDTVILGNQYHKNGKMRAGISFSVNEKGQWTQPQNIHIKHDYNISDQSNAFISLKNGVIISAIERAETFGGRDLYVSFWNGHEASEPVNMGEVINTSLEESAPFLDSDNRTMYFASKGHNGYGGYDIFVTKRLDDTWTNWSEPENLGPAVNGEMDDEFFTITHCGNYAIFAKQVSVHNVDIFRISVDELFTDSVARKRITIDNDKLTALASL